MSRLLGLSFVMFALIAAPSLRAQTSMPAMSGKTSDSADATGAKTAAKAFILAMANEEIDAAKALFAGTEEDFKLVEGMHGVIKSGLHLKTAAETKWPEEMKNQRASNDMDPAAMVARIDKEVVTIDGDTARFQVGMMLKKSNGEWKVVDMMSDPMGKGLMGEFMPIIAKVADETATAVEGGKYASFDEAKKDMEVKMRTAMTNSNVMGRAMKSTTRPATPQTEQPVPSH